MVIFFVNGVDGVALALPAAVIIVEVAVMVVIVLGLVVILGLVVMVGLVGMVGLVVMVWCWCSHVDNGSDDGGAGVGGSSRNANVSGLSYEVLSHISWNRYA